jgi:hypothetical protein
MFELNARSLFLKLLIASVAVSAAFGVIVVLLGNFGELEVRVLMTTLTVAVTSILGLACGAAIDAGRSRTLGIAGIVFSLLSAIALFLIIWNALDDSEIFIKTTLTLVTLAVVCSHLSLLSIATLDKRFAWSRTVSAVCDWLLAAILLFIMWFEPEGSSDLIYRIIGVLSIIIAALTVITPVFHKFSKGSGQDLNALDAEIEELRSRLHDLQERRSSLTNTIGHER